MNFLVLFSFVVQVSTPSNSEKVEPTVKDEEDYLVHNYDDGNKYEDFQVAQQSKVSTYYETEVMEIKEDIIDAKELKKNMVDIKPIDVQIVENITLSKKDLKHKYYDVKKEKNRTYYFCKNCREKLSKLFLEVCLITFIFYLPVSQY